MQKAFSLIEAVIVLAVLMLLVGLSSLSMVSFGKSAEIDSGRAVATQAIREAQSNSLANLGDTAWGVHFDSQKAVVFAGESYNSADAANRYKVLPANLQMAADFGGPDLFFNKGKNSVTSAGTVTITGEGKSMTITVNSEGMIE